MVHGQTAKKHNVLHKNLIPTIKEALAQPEQEPNVDCNAHQEFLRGYAAAAEYFPPQPKEPEQEPVALVTGVYGGRFIVEPTNSAMVLPVNMALYAHPQPRKPLTHEQMKKIWYAMQNIMGWYSFQEIARAIEAAHGIKG